MKAVVEGCSPLPRGCVRGCVSRPEIRGKQRKDALTSLPGPALQPVGNKSRDRAAASCPGILCFVGERAPIGGLEFLISLSLLGANARPEIVYSHPDGLETEFTLPARSWFHGTPHFLRWADQRNGCSLGRPSEVRQGRRRTCTLLRAPEWLNFSFSVRRTSGPTPQLTMLSGAGPLAHRNVRSTHVVRS